MSDEDRQEHAGPAGPGLAPTPVAEPPETDPVGPAPEAATPPARQTVPELAVFIVEHAGPPIDVWALAALLESVGIRDRDAVERFGLPDVFALARAVQAELPEAPGDVAVEEERRTRREGLTRFAKIYGRGTFFFVPLALQLVALLVFDVSQFASLDFTNADASRVAVAAALSFTVTAAFSQALGYLAPVYIESGKHMAAETVSWTIIGLGALAAMVVGAIAYAVGYTTDGYSHHDLTVMTAYYLLLAAQGLAGAMLYMLRKYLAMVVATIISLAVAAALYHWTSVKIEKVHYAALAVGVLIELGVGLVIMHRRARNTKGDLRLARLPRARILARRALPFALYGVIYFLFLTSDRAVAWAAGSNPLPLWFHTPYELGLDFALGGIVFALAFLEVTVEDFSEMLTPAAERFRVDAVREHNRAVARFWSKQLAYIGVLMAAGAWLAVSGAVLLHKLGALGAAEKIYDDPVSRYVFGLGLLGYAMLTLGIANSVFVMSLNRPWRAVTAIGPGVLVSVVVGIVATSRYDYWTAVFGMVVGAGVFAVLSSWQAWRTLRQADFHSYAAY
ncbi:MAG: hypothetical protein ACJ762_00175 [Solirubrobacteraceae bacterium]